MKKYTDISGKEISQRKYLYGERNTLPVPQAIIDSKVEALMLELEAHLDHSLYTRQPNRTAILRNAIDFWENINDN